MNIISPAGYAALRAEYDALLGQERPKLVEVISWAAGNGDRGRHVRVGAGADPAAEGHGGACGCSALTKPRSGRG